MAEDEYDGTDRRRSGACGREGDHGLTWLGSNPLLLLIIVTFFRVGRCNAGRETSSCPYQAGGIDGW